MNVFLFFFLTLLFEFFTDDYLMVYLPGHFLHLLNCSTELEPCHHIILQGNIIINKNATQTFQFKCAYINGDIKMPLLSQAAQTLYSILAITLCLQQIRQCMRIL